MATFGYNPTDAQLDAMYAKYTDPDHPWDDICVGCGCNRFAHWIGSAVKSGYGPCMVRAHRCATFVDSDSQAVLDESPAGSGATSE